MRNILAILFGVITLFLIMAIITFVLINFDIEPFSKFSKGAFNEKQFFLLSQKILFLNITIIFPIISFVTGLVAAIFARNKEYLIGFICVLPILIMFFDLSLYYFLQLLSVSFFMIIGVRTAKYFKSKK